MDRVMDCLWTSESEIDRSGCRIGVGSAPVRRSCMKSRRCARSLAWTTKSTAGMFDAGGRGCEDGT